MGHATDQSSTKNTEQKPTTLNLLLVDAADAATATYDDTKLKGFHLPTSNPFASKKRRRKTPSTSRPDHQTDQSPDKKIPEKRTVKNNSKKKTGYYFFL